MKLENIYQENWKHGKYENMNLKISGKLEVQKFVKYER